MGANYLEFERANALAKMPRFLTWISQLERWKVESWKEKIKP